ncbi:hypothetical protein EVAR_29835_1 [Eumeta japonica]|uniref:Uncharacterized protein n=1 Tax=Eumeta variegata TaxID=151549 RepID=A0A4C1VT05_EUMVA|nr:hypothetical protein EVAR_29835_1 [Eumeta japonica]
MELMVFPASGADRNERQERMTDATSPGKANMSSLGFGYYTVVDDSRCSKLDAVRKQKFIATNVYEKRKRKVTTHLLFEAVGSLPILYTSARAAFKTDTH